MRRTQSTRRAAAYQLAAMFTVIVGTIILLAAMPVGAQPATSSTPAARGAANATSPSTDAAPAQSSPNGSEAQSDQEWLTAYMMAHQGYRLDHMPALEDKFGKMTPTQLGTLRDFYQQKHEATMQQQALFHRMQAMQVSNAEAQVAKQQRAMNMINTEQTEAANVEDQRINTMHQEAAEAAMQNRAAYPGRYGGYPAYPYGYGGFYGGYRPYGY